MFESALHPQQPPTFNMFNILRVLAYTCAMVPLAASFILDTPASTITSGEEVTITFTKQLGDPKRFTLELVNTDLHSAFAIANDVSTSAGEIIIALPIVAASDDYALRAVSISDIDVIYALTAIFTILAD
ncbi:uncharacterized protein STEHIDRAFT_156194 [Stereum hirsutum FP-91666 SS1]|uniref:uncharacterized protein n=1 Tax=Stereum hirsutum (strain FP-91666) TaxID=721885 RepID=UPI0004409D65|nr:uncharacterized protein STEHIDRAFT_156194 [Stereum hirsutum FP-91666 SS1]EIM87207.1 hypothetical protein STEHIDRAFT_156194 [Stereum hirsutum FP-91666 SS1]